LAKTQGSSFRKFSISGKEDMERVRLELRQEFVSTQPEISAEELQCTESSFENAYDRLVARL
jgi:hypothetical protein